MISNVLKHDNSTSGVQSPIEQYCTSLRREGCNTSVMKYTKNITRRIFHIFLKTKRRHLSCPMYKGKL